MTWAEFIAGLPAYSYQPQAMTAALARDFATQAWARVLSDIWRPDEALPADDVAVQYYGAVNAAAMVVIAAWERDPAAQQQWDATYYDQIAPARTQWRTDPLNTGGAPQMRPWPETEEAAT